MDDHEWDLIILRGCLAKWGLRPGDPCCPDIEAIANSDGSTAAKVDRLGDELATNLRDRRQPA